MAAALELFLDESGASTVRALRGRLADAGLPAETGHPHVTLAVATAIPDAARAQVRAELELLSIPDLWLYTLAAFPNAEDVLVLGAVVDTEVLALHNAVHDALAGRTRGPDAHYLPGAWIPHCTLATGLDRDRLAAGISALHPIEPVHARIGGAGIVDTRTGDVDTLLRR
ncbi:2'-5' RNA ligase family protein [Saccharopolyspora sp. HNM0983]|uniref:2'-5' RNA ligase family protein n=1 Tax=Saccharopolyspora montiporae TaxID=2781240 RepID=A0A929FZU7_9PSEU|nr:2'-5' RNA ligase family protein [Saccharopolyspora sp. HNM0983]MBE9374122.1 2'-5' RNA ligase family protein [Saccharopolyspora sp. HNM0983]